MYDYPNSPTTSQVVTGASGAPYTWDGTKWTGGAVVPVASSTIPLMDGTAAVGTGTTWARADHVHPTDTTRAPVASPTFTGTATANEVQAVQSGWGGTIFSTYTGAGTALGFYNAGTTMNFGACDTSGNWLATYMSLTTAGVVNATGSYQVAATQVVGARITGYGTPTGPVKLASFPGASATLAQTSAMVAQLITDLKTHGLLGA